MLGIPERFIIKSGYYSIMTLNNSYLKTGYTSFEEMYKVERHLIFGIVLHRVGKKTIAEDLTQDTFIKILRGMDNYQPQETKNPKTSFRSWISSIAINHTINYFNRNKLRSVYEDDFMDKHLATPENLIIVKEDLEAAVRSLHNLANPTIKKIAQLWFYEDKSYREISDELAIPIGYVKSGLHRAKQKMQVTVAEDE